MAPLTAGLEALNRLFSFHWERAGAAGIPLVTPKQERESSRMPERQPKILRKGEGEGGNNWTEHRTLVHGDRWCHQKFVAVLPQATVFKMSLGSRERSLQTRRIMTRSPGVHSTHSGVHNWLEVQSQDISHPLLISGSSSARCTSIDTQTKRPQT